MVQFGQSMAVTGRAAPELSVGLPYLVFAGICVLVFVTSRKRPGETPIGRAMEHVANFIARFRARASVAQAASS